MTQEQIDKECDAIENKFIDFGMTYEEMNECSVRYQTGIVEAHQYYQDQFTNQLAKAGMTSTFVDPKLTEAKQILETLKSRVK